MFLVCSIFSIMKFLKFFWLKIFNTIAYLKNQNFCIENITFFKHLKREKPNLQYLKILNSYIEIYISQKRDRN